MTLKRIALAVGALLAAALIGYGLGRYATPAKKETKTAATEEKKTAAAEVKHEAEKESRGPAQIVTVTKWLPAKCPALPGAAPVLVPEVTVTENRGAVIIDRVEDSAATLATASTSKTETTTTVTQEQPRLMLQAGAVADLSFRPTWNLGASYRFAGPLWLGAAYHSDKRLELRVSLTF